jgi:hypothetical protein
LGSLKSKSTPTFQVGALDNKGLPLPLRSSGGSCRSARNALDRPTMLGKPTQIGKLVREDCRNLATCALYDGFGSIAFNCAGRITKKRFRMANHPSRLPILAAICAAAAIVAMPGANAASKFDGTWTAVFRTRSGPCQPAYRGAVQVVDGVMEVGGTMGSLIGRVSRNGSVRATGYMGANYGVASGRVSVNFGSGTWRAHTQSGNCVGVWNAQRR